ncbi:MAG: D-alanine--D-alanine ligase [Nitrospirae bacterium]|nr:D-alanine--D-alanine ligase [Nitrospirota bacterium]
MISDRKIGVLMGGLSSEREISLKTGRLVAASLKRKGYNVAAIDVGRDLPQTLINEGIGAAFIALHGKFGEDGCVQGLLELMGIPYTGSGVSASAVCMDKLLTKEILLHHGLPTPKFSVLNKGAAEELPAVRYPVVVKPLREGSTIGISIVQEKTGLKPAIDNAFQYGDTILLEEYIAGREITAGIIRDTPLPLVEIVPRGGFYDFNTKTTGGMAEYIVPAELPSAVSGNIQDTALKAHKALGCCYVSRVDFRVDPAGQPYILEVNTVPGMTDTSLLPKAAGEAGIGYDELVEMILSSAFTGKASNVLF